MSSEARQPERRHADLDDYDVDLDDIFGDITPPPGREGGEGGKRKARKDVDSDGDEPVAKRARAPRVKLDDQRLLSDEGIPRLRARARGLKFKGKSHEFSDAARLLSFYQLWLDDLFPKAKFLDALSMVEKTGHKTTVMGRRKDWMAEERRKELGDGDVEQGDEVVGVGGGSARANDEDDPAGAEREMTPAPAPAPVPVDLGQDVEDIYGATPPRATQPAVPADPGQPDDDDDDGLEAFMMEAERRDLPQRTKPAADPPQPDEFADEEAAMAEMEGLW